MVLANGWARIVSRAGGLARAELLRLSGVCLVSTNHCEQKSQENGKPHKYTSNKDDENRKSYSNQSKP